MCCLEQRKSEEREKPQTLQLLFLTPGQQEIPVRPRRQWFAFQGRIKTERKSCHTGGRGRGRRTLWCHVAQFWALLPRSAGLWFRSKLAGRLGVCTLRLPEVVFNPPGASSPAEGRTSPVSWGCAGGDGKPGLSLHTSCSPRYWQCRSPRLSWVNGSSFHCQVDYMS